MSTATKDTVTVTFDANSTNKQADVIGPASANRAGVMTAQQSVQLAEQAVQIAELLAGGGGDAAPLPGMTGILHVNKGGNDATANGTESKPFLTLQAATSFVTDATPDKRYVILVGPGKFDEPVAIKPWVFIVGVNQTDMNIGGAVTLAPEWNTPAGPTLDARGGFSSCTLAGPVDINFAAVSSEGGKFYAYNVVFNGMPTFTAFSAINQITLDDVRLFAGLTQNGLAAIYANVYVQGDIAVNSVDNLPTYFSAFGGGSEGGMNVVWTVGTFANPIAVQLLGFAFLGAVRMDGAQASLTATVNALPQGSPVRLNSAPAPVLLNSADSLGYVPTTLANWSGVPPVSAQNAFDRLAAAIGPIP